MPDKPTRGVPKSTSAFQLLGDRKDLATGRDVPLRELRRLSSAGATFPGGKEPKKNTSKHRKTVSGYTETNLSGGSDRGERSKGGKAERELRGVIFRGASYPSCSQRSSESFVLTLPGKAILYTSFIILVAFTATIVLGEFLFLPSDFLTWCSSNALADADYTTKEYSNPDYDQNPCRFVRLPQLLFLTVEECDLSRRMLISVVFGGAIGFERRDSDRPAGIRTMSLVGLGACFFTICSMLAFKSSTMEWDASRVAAAIPSGVGFLGAGLIWKGTVGSGDEEMHQVHGLTTAASVWLSAAVGVGCGAGMYFVSAYSVALVIFVLRYGPRLYLQEDPHEDESDSDIAYEDNLVSPSSELGSDSSKQSGDSHWGSDDEAARVSQSVDHLQQAERARPRRFKVDFLVAKGVSGSTLGLPITSDDSAAATAGTSEAQPLLFQEQQGSSFLSTMRSAQSAQHGQSLRRRRQSHAPTYGS